MNLHEPNRFSPLGYWQSRDAQPQAVAARLKQQAVPVAGQQSGDS
ncbi:hypothetical protein [Paraburkholderia polaris]|jgi:hypothetical protein|nr:hypothetical protein [Paraburkholderia polaris]